MNNRVHFKRAIPLKHVKAKAKLWKINTILKGVYADKLFNMIFEKSALDNIVLGRQQNKTTGLQAIIDAGKDALKNQPPPHI